VKLIQRIKEKSWRQEERRGNGSSGLCSLPLGEVQPERAKRDFEMVADRRKQLGRAHTGQGLRRAENFVKRHTFRRRGSLPVFLDQENKEPSG
jgi:hypothetical protein